MQTVCLHNQHEVASFLQRQPFLHLYSLGDLDDFFWPYTTWYALQDSSQIVDVVLLYTGSGLPTLLALTAGASETMQQLLNSLLPVLPRKFYAHISDNLSPVFSNDYAIASNGLHYKMALTDATRLGQFDTSQVEPLSTDDVADVQVFYDRSYPGNWFDPRMLQTGYYFGIKRNGTLVSIGGVHVYSQPYNVAALGNITTHPDFRGQGLSKAVCSKLCQSLRETVAYIGLNVKADNHRAIAAYQALGFEVIAEYEECTLTLRRLPQP